LRKQLEDEPVDKWVTELRRLAKSCDFGDLRDDLIKDAIVLGVNDSKVKARLLREKGLNLEKAKDICKVAESSKVQLKQIVSQSAATLAVDAARYKQTSSSKPPASNQQANECRFCGRHHRPRECPAFGKNCNKCGTRNHFAAVCRKSTGTSTAVEANAVELAQRRETFYVGAVGAANLDGKWLVEIDIKGIPIVAKIDTGADINIIPISKLQVVAPGAALQPFPHAIKGVGNCSVKVLGELTLPVKYKNEPTQVERFAVVPDHVHGDILLRGDLCERLKLLARSALAVSGGASTRYAELTSKYTQIFDGLGRSTHVYKPKIDQTVRPIVKPCRRIPHAMMIPLKNELTTMESLNVIAKVDEPTDWVSQLVVGIKKSGDLRICLDPQALNTALCREHYHMPVVEDLMDNLNGSKVFSKMDLKTAFWQILLDETTTDLFCFATPFGRYKFLRMPYGIKTAQEVCHRMLCQVLEGLEFVKVNVDDILVHSKDTEQHIDHLEAVFKRIQSAGLRLNSSNCEYGVQKLTFLGFEVTTDGLKVDDEKVEAISKMPDPKCKTEVRIIVGMINFVMDFVPDQSSTLAPLNNLLRDGEHFDFDANCKKALQSVLGYLSSKPVLQHHDPNAELKVVTDASKVGLGAVLMQKNPDGRWLPVKYASRAVTPTESRWPPSS
jgi:hypothetical protein